MRRLSLLETTSLLFLLTISCFMIPLTLLVSPVSASPDWLTGWNYRRQLTINGALIDETLSDFPVLVKLDSSNFDFSKAKTNAEDIRFTSADETTLLSYEIEKWNSAGSNAQIWVKIPSVTSGANTVFFMYYGNSAATDAQDPANVWNSNFKLVQHLKETSGIHQDSTSNNNDGTSLNGVVQGAPGIIDGADDFDGSNDYVNTGGASALTLTELTLEAWIQRQGTGVITSCGTGGITTGEPIIAKGRGYAETAGWNVNYFLAVDQPTLRVGFDFEASDTPVGQNYPAYSTTAITNNNWYYAVATFNTATTSIYLNGTLNSATAIGHPTDYNPWDVAIGSALSGATGSVTPAGAFNGIIDEVRISSVARSPAWVEATFLTESNSLLTYGAEETSPLFVWHFLTVSTTGTGSTNATGTTFYVEGSAVGISASAASGWVFDHWVLNGTNVGTVNPYDLTMTDSYVLDAVFVELPPGEWLYKMKLNLDNSAVAENLVDFPVLINLTRAGSSFWNHVNSNVDDLKFLDSDGITSLYFEVEYWNPAADEGLVWVKVPQIDANSVSDFIYISYGNSNPPVNLYNSPTNVWNNNYVLVMHLSEASGTRYDSTVNNNDGTTFGGIVKASPGRIDGADDFDNTNDYMTIAHSASLNYGDIVTFEYWVSPHLSGTFKGGVDKGSAALYLLGNTDGLGKIRLGRSGSGTILASTSSVAFGSWTYVAATKNGNDARMYFNGQLDAQTTSPPYSGSNNTNTLQIGQRPNYSEFLNAGLDEVRISNIARSPTWIKAQYMSMNDQYLAFGTEEPISSNVAPILGSIGSKSADELVLMSFTALASDADLPPQTLTFSLADGTSGSVPAGASITAGGAFTWTPSESQGPGTYTFDVVVSDGALSDSETITITVNEVNVAPVLNSIGDKNIEEENMLSFTATASDADTPPQTLTFSLANGQSGNVPAGAAINAGGEFTWTPTAAQGPGSYTFDVEVSDGALSDSETITITVSEGQLSLSVVSGHGSPDPTVGTHFYADGASVTASVISPVTEGNLVWTCTGWTGTGSVPATGTGATTTFTITTDSSITWTWASSSVQRSLTVTSAHDSPNPTVGAHSYDQGTSITASITSPVTEGNLVWTCTGWTGTGSVPTTGTGTSTTFTITADSSIAWIWSSAPIQFTITPSAGIGGSINPNSPLTVDYGSTPSFTVLASVGYRISDVRVDGISVIGSLVNGVYTFPSVTANHAITATFVHLQHYLTVSTAGTGSTNATGTTYYEDGAIVAALATPGSGWVFDHWVRNGTSLGSVNPLTMVLSNSWVLQAVFTQVPVGVFADDFESGGLSNWLTTAANSGSITVASSQKHSGTYAAHATTSGSGGYAVAIADLASTQQTLYMRYYLYINSENIADGDYLALGGFDMGQWDTVVGPAIAQVGGNLRWSIAYAGQPPTYNTSTTTGPLIGRWYCVEFAASRSSTTGWARLYVDGALVLSSSNINTGSANYGFVEMGFWSDGYGDIYFDDLTLANTYIGPISTPGGPTYSDLSISNSHAGKDTEFSILWNDPNGLSRCIFSTNATGTWTDSALPVSGTSSWANTTRTLPNVFGVTIGYRWICNDSLGNMGDTGIKFLTTSGDWQYAKKITFNSAAISENLANVPVLINLANAGADFWSHVSSNNNDLRFLDTDCTTELYYEVESWDHASHQGLIWVKVPRIAASSATDFIYMEYGNPYPPASMYQDSAKVWGSDYKLVQHLKETTGTHQDSSAFNNDGSPLNGVLQGVAGKIDGADDLDGTNDYISFGTSSSLTLTSFTIEAWVRRDGNGVTTATSGGTGGFTAEPIITKGNSYNDNPGVNINYFLGIQQTDNRIGLDFEDVENSGLNHAVIGSTPLVNGQWYYVVATYDGTTKIYLNGNLDVSTYLGVTPDSNQWAATAGTAIAGDGAGTPEGYFNGAIDEVRISQGARSAEWIEAQYLSTSNAYASFGTETTPPVPPNKPTNPSPTNGATGVSTSTSCSVTVSHPNSQAMDVSFYQAGTEAAPDFTLVVMPDTQNYATSYPNIFNQQTQWIVDNAASMNTLFVTQEGDVVNTDGSTTEWQNANTAMTILDNGNIPYGVAPGNHDLAGTGNFLTYFPYSRFSGETWYGGAYNNINSNSYQLFKGGDDNYLIFHITYDASDAVLAWADSVIDAHPNTRVIITTHHFLETNGNRDTEITLASRMWNNLITPHADQVFLVLCGHHHGEARRVDIVNGHPIYQILADYQSLSNGGNGYLRILNFRPSEDKIFVQTYSTYLNQYDTDSVSQFTLDYDMSGQEFSAPVLIGTANDVPSGGTATVQWNGLASSTEYYWFAIAEDAQGAIRQSDTWSFTTGVPPQPNYSEMGYSTTMPGASSNFSIRWTDPDGLTNCVFSTDNSGSWVDTPVAISGTNSLASIIITLPSTPGTTVHYRWTCEDTLGNKGDTGIQSLVTSSNAQYVKKITFNNGAIGENLVNVPVLVNLNRAGTDFWSHVNSNVNDLRFMDSDFTTELYYEVEYWNYASHQGSVWVKVPQINAGSATDLIYLFYGNSNPPTNPYNSPTNVWDSNYALVMHLGEASGTRYDSTGNNNDASTGGTPTATTGLVDGACDFDSTSDYLEAADSSSLDFGDVVTLEMWLNPHDVDTNIGGIDKGTGTIYLMGNNTAGHYGKIRLGLSATGTIVASKTAIPENTWSYVVGTKNGADARIYINGALDNQITTTAYTGTNNANNLRIGQRSGYASEGLNSILDEVRISKIARSAGWIQSQYLSISDQYVTFGSEQAPPSPPNKPTAPNPADDATGVSTSPTCSVTVTDPDGDPMDVSFYQVTQRQQTAQDFSIVVLPDTQIYSASYPNIFTSQTQWIVSNKAAMNILFVTHEGDVIDSYSTTSQWTNAVNSMSILDGNVPYGIAPGNHDLNQGSTTTNFNTYFGTSKFAGESWYGGSYNGDNANSYEFFSNGADQYLIIHLMNNPSTAVLTWAGSVVDAYPNHRVIVTTHEYLSGGARSTVGNNIWSNFIQSRTDQIFLVLCGHNLGESSATDTSTGHTVYQLMADYQGYTNGGNGYLRLLNFKPAQDQIYIQTYSPYLNAYETDSNSQFTLAYDMSGQASGEQSILIGTALNVPSGNTASIQWNGLNPQTEYYWYAVASDADGGITQSDTWSFTTGTETNENIYLVVRGLDNGIYARIYSATSQSWGNWITLPGQTVDTPAVAVVNNELHIIVRGGDGFTLWHGYMTLDDNSFSGWSALSGSTPSSPTLTSNGTSLTLVVRGSDNAIYYQTYSPQSRVWNGWGTISGGTTCDKISAVMQGNLLQVFVRGFSTTDVNANNTLWQASVNLDSGSSSGWIPLAGSTPSAPSSVLVKDTNTIEVIVRGDNNMIYRNIWDGSSWLGWIVVPIGDTISTPAAAVVNNDLYFVVVGMNNGLYFSSIDLVTNNFSGWTDIGGSTSSAPVLVG